MQENFNHRIFDCLNPKGVIPAGRTAKVEWIFSPLEANTYMVRYSMPRSLMPRKSSRKSSPICTCICIFLSNTTNLFSHIGNCLCNTDRQNFAHAVKIGYDMSSIVIKSIKGAGSALFILFQVHFWLHDNQPRNRVLISY